MKCKVHFALQNADTDCCNYDRNNKMGVLYELYIELGWKSS